MIELLNKIEGSFAEILERNIDCIKTMYIDYHKPYVSRVWFIDKENDCRVFLHKIEPCQESKETLYHPHKWDSVIRIIQGEYEMGVGHSETDKPPKTDCVLILGPGTCYSMTEKDGWHYVSPKKDCVYSLMVIPNKLNGRKMPIETKKKFRKLTKKEVEDIFYVFSEQYVGFSMEFSDLINDVQEKQEVKREIIQTSIFEDMNKSIEDFNSKIIETQNNVVKDVVKVVQEEKPESKPVQEFNRGNKVNFKGNTYYAPMKGTYVWAVSHHEIFMYYIEHPDGNMTKERIAHDGPHSKNFKTGLKYICVTGDQLEKA